MSADIFRRFLVVAALMFWQGGFTFYAAVVVPVGQGVLGSAARQGLITRQVTNYLNLAGALALVPLGWEALLSKDRTKYRRLRLMSWLVMAAAALLLIWLHGFLDDLFDPEAMQISDRHLFRAGHRSYLWVSTLQWASAILYLILALRSWHVEDRLQESASASAQFERISEDPNV